MGAKEVITRQKELARLGGQHSNQIFTPEDAAKALVNTIGMDLLRDPRTTYFDPCAKSGMFYVVLYNVLMQTLKDAIPDEMTRAGNISFRQLYGIGLNFGLQRLTSRMLLGKNYVHRNTLIAPDDYLELIKLKDRNIIQEIVNEGAFKDMKFDVIIGNPPYQESTGGGTTTEMTMPLYNYFVEKAIEMKPSLVSMIIPSRWLSGGKSVLDDFRRNMVEGRHIKSIYNYERASDIFEGQAIAGGVQFFTYSKDYTGPVEFHNCKKDTEDIVVSRDIACHTYKNAHNKEQYMVITDNQSAVIADSVKKFGGVRMDESVLQYRPFGLGSDFEDSLWETPEKPIKVICSKGRETWTDMESITQNKAVVGKWKVCVGKVTGYTDDKQRKNAYHPIINVPFVIEPNQVCSMSYLVLGTLNDEEQAKNCKQYIKTKLARFLVSVTLVGMNMTSRSFMFVPVQDYSKAWTDEELYKKYNLTQEQIDYIESRIKVMG